MDRTYLQVDYAERQAVKDLGARWDPGARKWYVPEGRDLTPFDHWLPAGNRPADGRELAPATEAGTALASAGAHRQRGTRLSEVLSRVAQTVSQAFSAPVWVAVEVVEAKINNHVYLDLAERDAQGSLLARARATIWARDAANILPKFQEATGMTIGPGIKLLVRARPTFAAQYGFSLVIDQLDPDYTLGDLVARQRELRARLQREGLWDRNRQLERPWDFNEVLVISPHSAAGLGDFQAEAQRLAAAGLCCFTYVHSRFQGEGAAQEIADTAEHALQDWAGSGNHRSPTPDVVVLIRGGGSVNDLAWLNDYALARFVCLAPVPVFTGIGHEKDNTTVDEVAHTRFDTPSKVIAGIETAIGARAREAQALYQELTALARTRMVEARRAALQARTDVCTTTLRASQQAGRACETRMGEVETRAMRSLRAASDTVREQYLAIGGSARTRLAVARAEAPALLARIRAEASASLEFAARVAAQRLDTVLDRAQTAATAARATTGQAMDHVAHGARRGVAQSHTASEALFREINGQGPEKTLARGFAVIRDPQGHTIKSAGQLPPGSPFTVTFRDGAVRATAEDKRTSE